MICDYDDNSNASSRGQEMSIDDHEGNSCDSSMDQEMHERESYESKHDLDTFRDHSVSPTSKALSVAEKEVEG